jgi:hypothetical protein
MLEATCVTKHTICLLLLSGRLDVPVDVTCTCTCRLIPTTDQKLQPRGPRARQPFAVELRAPRRANATRAERIVALPHEGQSISQPLRPYCQISWPRYYVEP